MPTFTLKSPSDVVGIVVHCVCNYYCYLEHALNIMHLNIMNNNIPLNIMLPFSSVGKQVKCGRSVVVKGEQIRY